MHLALLLFLGLLVGGGVACDGCRDEEERASKAAEEASAPPKAQVDEEEKDQGPPREVYGLPLPPKVGPYHEFENFVRLYTPMSLDDLERFYKARLVDFEVLRDPNGVSMRVVGLRAYMPHIQVLRRKGARMTEAYYYPSQEKPKVAQPVDMPTTDEEGNPLDPDLARKPGTPVTVRTPDGELLAPGARWGEPYTPPEGTPLHTRENRANFGRPFGEWDLR